MLPETAPARTAPVTLLAVPRLPMLACVLTTTMITVHLLMITQLFSVSHYLKFRKKLEALNIYCSVIPRLETDSSGSSVEEESSGLMECGSNHG